MFKENKSRFSVLLDNNSSSVEKKQTINVNPKNINKETPNRDSYRKSNNLFFNYKREEPTKKDFVYSDEMFPCLTDEHEESVREMSITQNFMEKLLSENKNDNNENLWILPDGWVEITKDKENSKINYNYGKNMKPDNELTIFDVCQELLCKYEKWEKEYIDKWGQDEYEKMYKFPNYDYHYFDALDEKYTEESDNECDNDEEYADSCDEYSDYY